MHQTYDLFVKKSSDVDVTCYNERTGNVTFEGNMIPFCKSDKEVCTYVIKSCSISLIEMLAGG